MQILSTNNTVSLILEIANSLRDLENVERTVLSPSNVNPNPIIPDHHWDNLSLASGSSGLLLLFAELDRLFPEQQWDQASHQCVLRIKASLESSSHASLSLFGGLAGVAYSIQQASRGRTRYQKMIHYIDSVIIERIENDYLLPMREKLQASQSCSPSLYELIQGLSGIGVYCLHNNNLPSFQQITKKIIHQLLALIQPIEINGKKVPGWYVSAENQFLESEKYKYPQGNFNLGLSHGIPGVLAFLSVARLYGVCVNGQNEAIHYLADWIYQKKKGQEGAFYWDSRVTFEEEVNGIQEQQHAHPMYAWCYGTPGVARSLYLAGKALKDESMQHQALSCYRSIFNQSRETWHLPSPTFCHGLAGLLTITNLMAQDSQDAYLKEQVTTLETMLLEHYREDIPFGFRDYEPSKNSHEYVHIDKPGLLEGTTGILLALLSLHTSASSWYFPFLISDGTIRNKI
jgi:lantibiotic modifying enzyme